MLSLTARSRKVDSCVFEHVMAHWPAILGTHTVLLRFSQLGFCPEAEAAIISLTSEKVSILLLDEEAAVVDVIA